jgi:hypothetical protein
VAKGRICRMLLKLLIGRGTPEESGEGVVIERVM